METGHILHAYDEHFETLRTMLSAMAGRAEAQLGDAVNAVVDRRGELALRVEESDRILDRMELDAERLAVEILARHAPVADDLRELISAIKIAGVLERIGDSGKNIAKRTHVLVQDLPLPQIAQLGEISGETRRMVLSALTAFLERESARARDVREQDARVDRQYDSLFRTLSTQMMESPRLITSCTHMLFAAKNLERVGDHATTIAQLAYYTVEGDSMSSHQPPETTAIHSSGG